LRPIPGQDLTAQGDAVIGSPRFGGPVRALPTSGTGGLY